ncbi:MAG: sugar-binding protein [Bacteroidota bacterium]
MTSRLQSIVLTLFVVAFLTPAEAGERAHPRLMADQSEIDIAREWIKKYPWYRNIFEEHRREIDGFIAHGPVYVSPLKQTYQYQMYTCPVHDVGLMFEQFKPFEHRCPSDTNEIYSGSKYDVAWAGWYNRVLASHLVWMGLLYNVYGDEQYAEAGREILMRFADLYLEYPTTNTILGPAHVFFGTLSESFWGVDMTYGYDLLYNYQGFSEDDHKKLKENLFYPLARITQLFPESASNRQLWYNNVSAAVGFFYGDQELIDFAMKGRYGFEWELGSALPESGFWPEWSGYHFVALRGMIHLAEMARHNGYDLYHMEIAGRTMKKMFDAPFLLVKPNYEFPRIKDSGGGSILEYAPFYEVGYAVYGDRKYLGLLNQTHLTRGTQVVGETSALGKAPEPITMFNLVPDLPGETLDVYPEQSVHLQGNGFAILRNGTSNKRRYLYLDYGIMGGEHGHPDRLQMGYYADGRNWIVDPLNESYMNPNLQLWYRQSIAHNTLVVDQTSQTWTNGYGNFYGALPALQVASGGSTSAYPGVALTRTLIQVGDYFIDLFDAEAPEKRIFDLPLHSLGALTLSGLELEPQPDDLFGIRPGIPGYDQLTGISSGYTDSTWSGVFTDKGKRLSVIMLGEPDTWILQAMTPPIGGFYKQMVKEQVPLPIVMSRRETASTRFASLIHSYDATPAVSAFSKGDQPGTYLVQSADGRDFIHVDIDRSQYWLVREEEGAASLIAGFNVQELRHQSKLLLTSPLPLAEVQCKWTGTELDLTTPEQFDHMKILAPKVSSVTLNGAKTPHTREGEYIVVGQSSRIAMTVRSSNDSLLFLGKKNAVVVKVWNPTEETVEGNVRIKLAADWKERAHSQLTWWGGIVNLLATNKGPVERTVFPAEYTQDASWIDGLSSVTKSIPSGGMETFTINIEVPNDAGPVRYPTLVSFGTDTVRKSLVVKAPVNTRMVLPNARENLLRVDMANQTPDHVTVTPTLTIDPAWGTTGTLRQNVALGPLETKRLDLPLTLTGYSEDNQLYPIRLRVEHEGYSEDIKHDFYVGVAHYASSPPALDGSWKGWDRSSPMLINKASQIGRLLFGNQPWDGEGDLSARISVMYDDTYLYVGAAVRDDSLVTHWDFPRMSYPWDTDCMEVVLDTRVNSSQGYDPPTPGLYRHLSMAEHRVTDFSAEMWQGAGAGGPLLPKPNLAPGAETYFHPTSDGYAIVARYPLSSLGDIIAKPGFKIGFDVAINDNDGTNYRKNQHIWAGYNQNQSWWDIGTIGALVFGPH